MFFDDRLATVLRHRAAGEHAARTQFRQLLDLLGNRKYGRDESLVAAAWLRLGALGEQIPAAERARMVAERGWRFRSPELAADLAEDEPDVAAAALSRAELTEDDWEALIPRLPIRARGFLRLRRDLPPRAEALLERLGIRDRALPQPIVAAMTGEDEDDFLELTDLAEDGGDEDAIAPAMSPEDELILPAAPLETPSASPEPTPVAEAKTSPVTDRQAREKTEIAALVERIAQFRRDREVAPPTIDNSPRLPFGEMQPHGQREIAGFGFVADTAGRIEWADASVAPMVIGKRLLPPRRLGEGSPPTPIARAFSRQQPIENLALTLEGAPAITGDWIVDAHPRFARSGGRFHGYVGRFRRPAPPPPDMRAAQEADRIRQLLHELRTPVNALQGFAEVIQQQLFGPAPHEYRALAASIAGDAARILAGFDELERLARLETGVLSPQQGETDFAALLVEMVDQLQQVLNPRMAGLELELAPDTEFRVAMDHEDAEALAWRVLATLAGASGAGEALSIELVRDGNRGLLACELPAQIVSEEDIFAAQVKSGKSGISAGLFGAGFSLRLARAEARAIGGDLTHDEDRILLSLPLLTAPVHLPSDETVKRSQADAAES
ncbi:histidine kinase dimerization/phospho-acceptor domain-containing protein [Altererythrobacter arenosus]|uniref:histidine kinase n=1 Tax=Altererythrobacter arenosus TaxID=3032592 RepID=A0ABY8FZU8_9SPHN|nr:histidine kinase dimerization/phospho-acceptor domain-containing protein [Altererythrobacter sp. CAU 1644]WFL77524.1 histidine kinase dimerization/phospho-acceptor domain-containing protein [Altererythrobacter sp. CAU 1644]